ncbi:ABC transporter substrate-binding protein [Saccharomonospora sp.]|uniref:ABC transporter substrate-binding protein n=1 Tax=Saccharomonospora sp. TaxID=33913 RepID=UPI002636ABA6|nr:ABC transporter substrate-binding protein [Saccharomonospora sp.]
MLRHGTTTRRKSRRGRLATAVTTAGLLASVSGCGLLSGEDGSSESQGGGNGSVEKSTITVAHLPSIDVAPLYHARDAGYFADEGLEVKIEQTASGQAATQKMLGGDADIVQSSYVPFTSAQASGTADIKLVADAVSAAPDTFVLVAKEGGPVQDVEDLEGKKIAVSAPKTISDTIVKSFMAANGLDHESVTWVQTSFPDIASAVANGHVDTGLLIEPFLTMGAEEHGVTPIADVATGPTQDMPLAGYGALAEFVEKNPKTVAAFQRAMERATEDAQDREVIEPVIQETAGIDAATASMVSLPNFHSALDASRIQRVADMMLEFGLIDEKVDVESMIVKPNTD